MPDDNSGVTAPTSHFLVDALKEEFAKLNQSLIASAISYNQVGTNIPENIFTGDMDRAPVPTGLDIQPNRSEDTGDPIDLKAYFEKSLDLTKQMVDTSKKGFSDTKKGLVDIIKDSAVVDLAKGMKEGVYDQVKEKTQPYIDKAKKKISPAVSTVAGAVTTIDLSGAVDSAKSITKSFVKTASLAESIGKKFIKVAGVVGGIAAGGMAGAAKGFKSVVDIIGKILGKVKIITDLIELAIQPFFLMLTLMFVPIFKAVAPMIKDVFNWVTENKDAIMGVGDKMVKIIKDIFDGSIADDMINVLSVILGIIDAIVTTIAKYSEGFQDDPFGTILNIFFDLLTQTIDKIAEWLEKGDGANAIGSLFDSFTNAVLVILPQKIDELMESDEWDRFMKAIIEVGKLALKWLQENWEEYIQPELDKFIEETLKPWIKGLWDDSTTAVKDELTSNSLTMMFLQAFLGPIGAMAVMTMQKLDELLKLFGIDIGADLQQGLTDIWSALTQFVSDVVKTIVDTLQGMWNDITSGISSFISDPLGSVTDFFAGSHENSQNVQNTTNNNYYMPPGQAPNADILGSNPLINQTLIKYNISGR